MQANFAFHGNLFAQRWADAVQKHLPQQLSCVDRNTVAAIIAAAPATPPGMRVRAGRFERLRSGQPGHDQLQSSKCDGRPTTIMNMKRLLTTPDREAYLDFLMVIVVLELYESTHLGIYGTTSNAADS